MGKSEKLHSLLEMHKSLPKTGDRQKGVFMAQAYLY